MTRAKPPPTFYTAEAISEGRHGCADGGPPPAAEPMGPISPSRPAPISTDLDTAPTASGSPRPPAFTIGDIPIFHTPDGEDSPPASDGNESGTMLGSSTISTNIIVHIQPGVDSSSLISLAVCPHSLVQMRAGKVTEASKPCSQMMHPGAYCMLLLRGTGRQGKLSNPPLLEFGEVMMS